MLERLTKLQLIVCLVCLLVAAPFLRAQSAGGILLGGVTGVSTVSVKAHTTSFTTTCSSGTATTCTFSSVAISTTGDTFVVFPMMCFASDCSHAPPASFTLSDGTNTYTSITNCPLLLNAWSTYCFVVANATAGTRTLTATATGGTTFYYGALQTVELVGGNLSSPIDASVSTNMATIGSSSIAISSAGHVSYQGEVALGVMTCTNTPTIAVSTPYTGIDYVTSPNTQSAYYQVGPTNGAYTTASMTLGSSQNCWNVLIGVHS